MKKQILFIALMLVQIFCGAAMASAQEKYQVGDFYCDDDLMGVVFWVDESGQHGKVVSITESPRLRWAVRGWDTKDNNAYDREDGIRNLLQISIKGSWMQNFPAFGWCEELGGRWYLPAIDELKLLLSAEVRNVVNTTIEDELFQLGGEPIGGDGSGYDSDGSVYWYWSSTEPTEPDQDIPCFAYALTQAGGEETQLDKSGYRCRVRAVANF